MAAKNNEETQSEGIKIVVQNRKARHDYEILDSYETGIVLLGTEVKSLRAGKAHLKDSYARFEKGEIFLNKAYISPYEPGNRFNHEPERSRKLLLHRREIRRLRMRADQQGLTMVPLKLYFKRGKVKVELGLVRGKKLHDKRHAIAEREVQRSIERALKDLKER